MNENHQSANVYSVDKLISEARRIAREYRQATGKVLPLTAEIAVNDAIRLLGLKAAPKDETGFDAFMDYQGDLLKVQIKGRAIFNEKRSGYRLGQLKLEQDWQAILLVLMDAELETEEIYLAYREDITDVLEGKQNKRGSISVARFKIIGELIWSVDNGLEDGGCWTNAG